MSVNKKTIVGLNTPGRSRVRQAFKSPFRGNVSSDSDQNGGQKATSVEDPDGIVTHKPVIGGNSSTQVTPKRSMLPKSQKARQTAQHGFNTPYRSPRGITHPDQAQESLEDQLCELKKQETEIDREIATLQELGIKTEELQVYIEDLHRYNEIKDAAQLVMGRLAELEEVTVKAMHEKYDISSAD